MRIKGFLLMILSILLGSGLLFFALHWSFISQIIATIFIFSLTSIMFWVGWVLFRKLNA